MLIKDVMEQQINGFGRIGHIDLLTRFVLKHGRVYQDVRVGTVGTPKECFKNAFEKVVHQRTRRPPLAPVPPFKYVEGFFMRDDTPFLIHHAWVEDDEGRGIEVTIPNPDGQYFGISFTTKMLLDEAASLRVYGLLDTGRGLNTGLMIRYDSRFIVEAEKAMAITKQGGM